MLNGIDERRISKTRQVKVRFFPGPPIKDMYHYLIPVLEKRPEHLILHTGTNDAVGSSHQQIVNDLSAPKQFIKEKLQNCNVILSIPAKHCDNQKASATLKMKPSLMTLLLIVSLKLKDISFLFLERIETIEEEKNLFL